MKNNKTPGSDGFTVEFYKFFWVDLKCFIIKAINNIFEKKALPVSQRLGIICCLPKGDKPRQHLKNWRPITLLNVFYKLISGCISQRIKLTLNTLISKTQTGFISGRYIGENTRLVYDIMSHAESNNIPGLLVLVDFEKAFDSIAWSFVYKVMKLYGFGENIIQWIKILNKNFRASILQSGFLSEQIDIMRGCRQGDPAAPYIFLLCAEILSTLIKYYKEIRGFKINDNELKISQYADDTTLTLDGSARSLFAALDTLELFSQMSGLYMNISKTKIVWIGSKKFSNEVFHHPRWKLEWGTTTFNLLGIMFSVNLDEIIELNYNIHLPKIKACIKQWSRRLLTPIGRVTVAKSIIIPKLNHLFISLPTPPSYILSTLTSDLFHFIWNKNCDKIKRETVTQDKYLGGLKMINLGNFITSLKCSWVKRIVNGGQTWLTLLEASLGKDLTRSMFDFGDDFIKELITKCENIFWKDLFQSWLKVMQGQLLHEKSPCSLTYLPIWHNSNIKIGNKSVFFKSWCKKGVVYVADFLDDRGNLLSKAQFEKKFIMTNINFMQYTSIKSSITSFLKKIKFDRTTFKHEQLPLMPYYFKCILTENKCNKVVYKMLNTREGIPTALQKWNTTFQFDGELKQVTRKLFTICFKTSEDTAMQWLQYRLLHKILPVNSYLKQVKIKDNDNCFCCGEPEDIPHLFVLCPRINNLWTNLSMYIDSRIRIQTVFHLKNILFGEVPLYNNIPCNFVILVTKQYIFRCTRQQAIPEINGLICQLKFTFKVEQCIANRNQKSESFDKIWDSWKPVFLDP